MPHRRVPQHTGGGLRPMIVSVRKLLLKSLAVSKEKCIFAAESRPEKCKNKEKSRPEKCKII